MVGNPHTAGGPNMHEPMFYLSVLVVCLVIAIAPALTIHAVVRYRHRHRDR